MTKSDIDLTARILSMGKLHHAMTGAIAIAVAAAIPGTIVENGEWTVVKAVMSRSAKRLMEGWVRVPI